MFNGFSWQTRTLEVRPDRLPPDFSDPTQSILNSSNTNINANSNLNGPNANPNANANPNSFHPFNRIHHPKPHHPHPHGALPFQHSGPFLSTPLPLGPPSSSSSQLMSMSPAQVPGQLQQQPQGQGPGPGSGSGSGPGAGVGVGVGAVGAGAGTGIAYSQDLVAIDGLDFSGATPSFSRKGSTAGLSSTSGSGGGGGGGGIGGAGKNLFVGNVRSFFSLFSYSTQLIYPELELTQCTSFYIYLFSDISSSTKFLSIYAAPVSLSVAGSQGPLSIRGSDRSCGRGYWSGWALEGVRDGFVRD